MPWFPDIASPAFCETVQLRRIMIERQQLPRSSWLQVLEPSNAEFVAALAAGNNAHHILEIGCGLSTIALAAAARATGSCLLSIHTDRDEQEIVNDHIKYLGLVEYVQFITDEPCNVIPQHDGVDFAFISGDPECYIQFFDSLRPKHGAIVVADTALDDVMNEYIKHVRRQPGVHSSTLPLGRGIEVTKIISWDDFISGRVFYGQLGQETDNINKSGNCRDMFLSDGLLPFISDCKLRYFSEDGQQRDPSQFDEDTTKRNVTENTKFSASSFQSPNEPEDSRAVEHLEGVTELNCSYVCPHSIECGGTYTHKYSAKLSETAEQLKFISKGDERQACHVCVASRGRHLQCLDDNVLPKEKVRLLDKNTVTDQTLLKGGLAETTSGEFMSRDVQDLFSQSAIESHEKHLEELPVTECELELDPEKDDSFGFKIHFRNDSSLTEVIIEGPDQDMLLIDITMAFNEMGISVQRAKISTEEKSVEDVFYVIDAETQSPLDPAVWGTVRKRMLQRFIAHRKVATE